MVNSLQPSNNIDEASHAYQDAIAAFTAFGAIPLAARGCSNKPEHQLKVRTLPVRLLSIYSLTSWRLQWVASIRRTSFANGNLLGTVARRAAASVQDLPAREEHVRWDCPWFPIWI